MIRATMKVFVPLLVLVGTASADVHTFKRRTTAFDSIKKMIEKRNLRKKSRKLQVPDACSVPMEDAMMETNDVIRLKPSYMANCIRSIEIDPELMLQHIAAIRDIFQEYYCFYNIINDPADSDPINYQPELGYSLFTGPQEGQVRLDDELMALMEMVESEGATVGNFYDIESTFNRVNDAHITVSDLAPGLLREIMYTLIFIYPGRNMDSETAMYTQSWEPSYSDQGVLQIKATFESFEGEMEYEMVTSIDGKTPFEWYFDLASNPGVTFGMQSVGARLNSAFSMTKTFNLFDFGVLQGYAMPPDILPDEFLVTYESGREEMYYTAAAAYSLDNGITWNATVLYDIFNSGESFNDPGPAFENFAIAVLEIDNATSADVRQMTPSSKKKEKIPPPETRSGHTASSKKEYEFDDHFIVAEVGAPGLKVVGGYKITDEYAVFKLTDFEIFQSASGGIGMIEMWSNFTQAAKEGGVKKAIIDISQNGGGIVVSGDILALSMYPFAPLEVFENVFDIRYNNAMMAYNATIAPLLDALKADIDNSTDTEFQEYIDTFPSNWSDSVGAVSEAVLAFCCSKTGTEECDDERCINLSGTLAELATLVDFQTGPQFRRTLESFIEALSIFNPFKVLTTEGEADPNQIYEVVRGGVAENLTNRFSLANAEEYEALYWQIVGEAFQNDWMFDEYVLLGDGTGGSTTQIFASAVTQLWNNRETMWNNRDVPPAPLTTVSYGGSNLPQDTTLAGFPASVQNSDIGVPIVTSAILFMLEYLLPGDIADYLSLANEYFSSFVAVPPYFSGSLPRMPVYNFYSNFMESAGLPVQYIKIFSDRHHHIPQVYTHVGLEDNTDLEELYTISARLGFTAESNPPPVNPPLMQESEDEPMGMPNEDSKDAPMGMPNEDSKDGV